jgi:hypothetical protein
MLLVAMVIVMTGCRPHVSEGSRSDLSGPLPTPTPIPTVEVEFCSETYVEEMAYYGTAFYIFRVQDAICLQTSISSRGGVGLVCWDVDQNPPITCD